VPYPGELSNQEIEELRPIFKLKTLIINAYRTYPNPSISKNVQKKRKHLRLFIKF
jgi:hypothetical protein